MKLILTIASIVAFNINYLVANEVSDNQINFHTGSFESGMLKASSEGKLLFVEFYADWCTPCKWMDKTTYQDSEVITKLNQDFVALKLDIETDHGDELKKEYSVRMLPTILIFNSEGKMLDRIEKTLSAESMKSLLSFHGIAENKIVVESLINSSPSEMKDTDNSSDFSSVYQEYLNREKYRTNYKLQIANYTDYTAALTKVNELNKTFMEPIVVVNEYIDNTTFYRVLLGEFRTLDEAEGYRKIIKRDFNMDSIIH